MFKKIDDIEEVEFEVVGQDFIPFLKANHTLVVGDGGVGKSLITLKMVLHYLNEQSDKNAICFYTEDPKVEIIRRMERITEDIDLTMDEAKQRIDFITIDEDDKDNVFCKKEGSRVVKTKYYEDVKQYIMDNNIGVVVIDPFERFHSGLSENDESDMKEYIMALQSLGVDTGAGIIILHHTPRSSKGSPRGSTAINNKGRITYTIRKNMEEGIDGTMMVKEGWEEKVILSTYKDNLGIGKECPIIKFDRGIIDLPIPRKEEPQYKDDGSDLPF